METLKSQPLSLPQPQPMQFPALLADIENGKIKIPQFQREFVWDMRRAAKLIDSIAKGYPIGTFIFWRTNERLRSVRNVGNAALPEPPDGEFVSYVLDGQQRITCLFASLRGLTVHRENGKQDNFDEIYVDLESTEDEQIVHIRADIPILKRSHVRLTELLHSGLALASKLPPDLHGRVDRYRQHFLAYPYSIVLIRDVGIDIATEVFTRINVTGKALSLFEIMVAKTFDAKQDFDLAERYRELIADLDAVNYETVPDATVLQVVAMLLTKSCKRQDILRLKREDFIRMWSQAVDAIKGAVDYFRGSFGIEVSRLLPYNALLVPFSFFFWKHPDRPAGDMQRHLQDFFWRCALSGRYSSGVETKLAQDVERIETIIAGSRPRYEWAVSPTPEFLIDNGWFSTGRSFIKAILCLYASVGPRSFVDGAKVRIDNAWLKIATSKNYHHFFPKAHMRRSHPDVPDWKVNNVVNITIVDDFLNKRLIRDKPPQKYVAKFSEQNPHLAEHLLTHLIGDPEEFGIAADDFDTFLHRRAEQISAELRKRLHRDTIDEEQQPVLLDDEEYVDEEEVI